MQQRTPSLKNELGLCYNSVMHELSFDESTWDKKKIAVTLIILVLVLVTGGMYVSDKVTAKLEGIKGAQIQNQTQRPLNEIPNTTFSFPSKENFTGRLDSIKKDIENINIQEIASSSPQIQKVLKDIQSIQQYPGNQAKEMCYNICRGL